MYYSHLTNNGVLHSKTIILQSEYPVYYYFLYISWLLWKLFGTLYYPAKVSSIDTF